MSRIARRRREVLARTGWSNSTLYEKIKAGKFPPGTKLDPDGRAVIWFDDEIEAVQKAAIENQISRN